MNFSLTEHQRFFAGFGQEQTDTKPTWKPFMKKGTPPKWCRDRVVDVKHIKLELAVDFDKKSIAGSAHITAAPINDGTSFLVLDACEMDITEVKADNKRVDWNHDGEKLTVSFGRDLTPDKDVTISVTYSATPRRGAYFVGPDKGYPKKHREFWTQGQDEDSRYWFPCFDYPNEKATTEIIARVPKGMTSLSNGALVHVEKKGDHELHHWKMDVPHVAYLVTLVIGDYVKVSKKWAGIDVDYYVPPGREADGERSFGPTPKMVQFFSEKIGVKYPYPKYAQITAADFIFGGMENTTATTQTELTLHDARAHLDFSSDPLNSHELAHQWFGDYLTCRDWSHAWLNESFATYFEAMWCEESLGDDEFNYYLDADWKVYLDEDRGAYRRPIQTNIYNEPLDLFDRHLYQKGAVILHHLRKLLGDRLWWKVINHYVTKHAKTCVITQDFADAIEDVTGRNFDWFFSQWIYGGGHPEFKLGAKWDEKEKQLDLSIAQTQKPDELTATFRTAARVRIVCKGSEESREFEIDKPSHRHIIKLPSRPLWLAFDPGNAIPKTLELDLPEDMLIAQLEHDDDVMGRVHAARNLARKPNKKVTDALAKALKSDKFWGVQAEAAYALGKVHSPAALEALIANAHAKHPKARRAVAQALGEWKHEDAAAALARMLAKDASYYVEAQAAASLGKTRQNNAYDALVAALKKESHNDVIRAHVFSGLCDLRDMRALKVMTEWTQYGRSQQARYAAISSLGRLAAESTEDKDKQAARETLEPLLEGDFRQAMAAIGGLRALKDAKAVAALGKLAATTHDSRIKRNARMAMEALREAGGAPKEIKALRDDYDALKKDYDDLKNRLEKIEGDKSGGKAGSAKRKRAAKR